MSSRLNLNEFKASYKMAPQSVYKRCPFHLSSTTKDGSDLLTSLNLFLPFSIPVSKFFPLFLSPAAKDPSPM